MSKDKDRLTQTSTIDLNAEIDELRLHPALEAAGRVAKTLAMRSDLRILLTVIRKGTRISEHKVPGSASVQTLRGEIALHIDGEVTKLPAGSVLILEQEVAHDVVAEQDSAFLVAMGWHDKK